MAEDQVLSEEQLKEINNKLRQTRANDCMNEIRESMKKHNCDLHFHEERVNGEAVRKYFSAAPLD